MKYRVRIKCRNEHLTECVAYVVTAAGPGDARFKACEMARQHYLEFDEFEPYGVEELRPAGTLPEKGRKRR